MTDGLPSGTVTFLFTDVEGSTKLLHQLGAEAYAGALAAHRQVIREAAHTNGGVEVDTQGDAFFIAFPTAPGALSAAEAMLDGLRPGPIRVRVGLHSGTPLLTDEGYVGIDVHRAARIAACAHGGQVVASAATANLVGRAHLLDLGEHRLKDLSAAERLFQVGSEDFPPIRTLYRTNLPIPATTFLGRTQELHDLAELLRPDGARLVTLTGPGGIGKTRLALQAAAAAADDFPEGIFWVPLAALSDERLVLQEAAQAIGTTGELAREIGGRSMLLVLDNFEQVVAAAAELASLLASCPNLRLIVTSRELLRVPGEQAYHVPALAITEATTLFVARARAADERFAETPEVEELCGRLEQLPLALELAAARVSVLSPQALLERLSQRLDILKAGRGVDPRQQTLRATIEWSHDLLSAEERELYRGLAVFEDGCTLEAAEAVLGADIDVLQALVDKSLVRVRDTRFWMLETIRAHALECLDASGSAEELRNRHAARALALAERIEPDLGSERQTEARVVLEAEHANLRSALGWLARRGDSELTLRLAGALRRHWVDRGGLSEGRRWLEPALAATEETRTPARAKALSAVALLAALQGDWPATRRFATEGRELALELDQPRYAGWSMLTLGRALLAEGDRVGALSQFEQAAVCGAKTNDSDTIAMAAFNLGYAALDDGQLGRARADFERVASSTNDQYVLARTLAALGSVAIHESRFADAQARLEDSLRVSRNLGERDDTVAWSLELLGVASCGASPERAARLLGRAETLRHEFGGRLEGIELALHEDALSTLQSRLGEKALTLAWFGGAAVQLPDLLEEVLDPD